MKKECIYLDTALTLKSLRPFGKHCLDMLLDLPDLLAGCLGSQVKVFTIQGVNQPFPIHLKPERHCRVKPDCRVRRIGKFKIYRSPEDLS